MVSFSKHATTGFKAALKVNGGNGKLSGNGTLFAIAEQDKGKNWKVDLPNTTRLRGMVIAADRLYVAGQLPEDDALRNVVRAYSLGDGKPLDQFSVDQQMVHDCLAVAGARVYVSTQTGKLLCLGE